MTLNLNLRLVYYPFFVSNKISDLSWDAHNVIPIGETSAGVGFQNL